jgi:hypothetical protein
MPWWFGTFPGLPVPYVNWLTLWTGSGLGGFPSSHYGLKKAKERGRVPGPRRNPVDLSKLRFEASTGKSLRQLAVAFNVSKDTVRSLLSDDQAAGEEGKNETAGMENRRLSFSI